MEICSTCGRNVKPRIQLGGTIEHNTNVWEGNINPLVYYDKISQQPENCENRYDPDLVQAFLKKWWIESESNIT